MILESESIRYADLAINITENSHIFVEAMINIFSKEQYLFEMENFLKNAVVYNAVLFNINFINSLINPKLWTLVYIIYLVFNF